MLNAEKSLSSLAEQVNGKVEEYENRRKKRRGDNIIDVIPAKKDFSSWIKTIE